jgi:hypothetical protein
LKTYRCDARGPPSTCRSKPPLVSGSEVAATAVHFPVAIAGRLRPLRTADLLGLRPDHLAHRLGRLFRFTLLAHAGRDKSTRPSRQLYPCRWVRSSAATRASASRANGISRDPAEGLEGAVRSALVVSRNGSGRLLSRIHSRPLPTSRSSPAILIKAMSSFGQWNAVALTPRRHALSVHISAFEANVSQATASSCRIEKQRIPKIACKHFQPKKRLIPN